MSELFVELFSEEIPARLQVNARNELKKNIKNFFIDNKIKFNENFNGQFFQLKLSIPLKLKRFFEI